MDQKTIIKTEEGHQDLIITRTFDLPVELLYKAYSEAEFIEQWMGTKVLKLEHKNHGCYQFETSYEGNVVFEANGTIHQVIPNKKIVRTFEMTSMPIDVQLEFLEFEEISSDKSKLTIHIIYKSEKHRAEQLKLPFSYGLNRAHDNLQSLFNTLK